jgi:hypothetical protein
MKGAAEGLGISTDSGVTKAAAGVVSGSLAIRMILALLPAEGYRPIK